MSNRLLRSRLRLILLLAVVVLMLGSLAQACSRILWAGKGGSPVIVGRNMDWFEEMRQNLWIFPRGIERNGLAAENPLKWTSKYGSLIVSAYESGAADGVNEKGLSANMLYLAESEYGKRDAARPGLCVGLWLQFCLDRFASVAEAVSYMESYDIQILPASAGDSAKKPIVLHLSLADSTGDSAIIEYVRGKARIYRGAETCVMTNSPTFDKQLSEMKRYKGFGGILPLPGTSDAADRFVRATYYARNLPETSDPRRAVAGVLSVLRNVSQPFGVADPLRPNISATIWRCAADLTDRVYYFESTTSPNIIWVKFGQLDFKEGSGVRKFDLAKDADLAGDVSGRFHQARAFEPMKPIPGN